MEFVSDNITSKQGKLYFAGRNVAELAEKYKTPLYLLDEDKIREKCRIYKAAFRKHFPEGSFPMYASKACSFKKIYTIISEEGLGIDVVSPGEIYTAVQAGFDMGNAFFQGNNKTDEDIEFAVKHKVGYFVADNIEELRSIDRIAGEYGICQKILLRLTPGIDTHTYEADQTGRIDSKFGVSIETGQAEKLTEYTLSLKNISLSGFQCHIGSQVFEEDVFERAAVIMLEFMARIKEKTGYEAEYLDLGGGYGVRYVNSDPYLNIETKIGDVAAAVRAACTRLDIDVPKILMEPGRSIVADAGMTVYTVGTIKDIPGYKSYVSIDGGMTDNPRFALYGAAYTCIAAGKTDEECDKEFSVVGRCCESGDIIQEKVMLPHSMCRGDILAVCTTGAYNYSMASNYNRIPRPPIVMIKEGEDYPAVRRETLDDICLNDL